MQFAVSTKATLLGMGNREWEREISTINATRYTEYVKYIHHQRNPLILLKVLTTELQNVPEEKGIQAKWRDLRRFAPAKKGDF